jgi:hypothetical protein
LNQTTATLQSETLPEILTCKLTTITETRKATIRDIPRAKTKATLNLGTMAISKCSKQGLSTTPLAITEPDSTMRDLTLLEETHTSTDIELIEIMVI